MDGETQIERVASRDLGERARARRLRGLPGRSLSGSQSLRRAVAATSLSGLAVLSLLLAVGAASGPSPTVHVSVYRGYPEWLAGPLAAVPLPLTPPSLAVLVIGMLACYLAAVAVADAIPVRWALASVWAVNLVFVLSPSLLHTDIFRYLAYARLGTVYGLNPYTHGAVAATYDPTYELINLGGFTAMPSPYGPLFTLASYPLAMLSMETGFWAIKAAGGVTSLGCVGLVWACARRLGRAAVPAVLFVGLNPLLLIWGIGAAHNDLLMTLLVLSGLYFALVGRERLSVGMVVLAAAVKAMAGLVLPFIILGARRCRRALVGAGVAVAVLGAVWLAAFGVDGIHGHVNALVTQQNLNSGHSVPRQVSRLFGSPRLPPDLVGYRMMPSGFYWATGVGLAGAVALLLWRAWRGADWISCAAWATVALLVTAAFLMPWYVIPAIPLAALAKSPGVRYTVLALTAYLVLGFTGQVP